MVLKPDPRAQAPGHADQGRALQEGISGEAHEHGGPKRLMYCFFLVEDISSMCVKHVMLMILMMF